MALAKVTGNLAAGVPVLAAKAKTKPALGEFHEKPQALRAVARDLALHQISHSLPRSDVLGQHLVASLQICKVRRVATLVGDATRGHAA